MNKKVLIFSTAYFPFVGGAEVAVKEITDRLSGFDFVMITAKLDKKLPDQEKIGNVLVYRLGVGDKWDKFRLILNGWKKAKELGDFDIVWSIMASYAGFAALRFKKRNPNIKYLLTLQEGDSKWDIYKHVWWCWRYFKQIFKKADRIQAISNYLADWAKKMGAKCQIDVVPNGVDINNFKTTEENRENVRENIRKELSLGAQDKVIVTASRLVKKNGVNDLIESLKFLNTDFKLLILGTGVLEEKLKKQVKENSLGKRVYFLGQKNHQELPKYFWASDVFCRPSLSEGLGNVFLEAMAAGLPVIGTKVGGIPDFLVNGETGLFCEVENPRDVANKIKQLSANKNLIKKLVENGGALAEKKYSWDLVSQEMEKIF